MSLTKVTYDMTTLNELLNITGTVDSYNYCANPSLNSITGGKANVIAGGGYGAFVNTITGATDYRTISGGYDNVIDSAIASTVTGGAHHRINPPATHALISGGSYGIISNGDYSCVVGGTDNQITSTGDGNVIIGGVNARLSEGNYNFLTGYQNTIVGGAVGGTAVFGYQNIDNSANYAFVSGRNNKAVKDYAEASGFQAIGRSSGGQTIAGGLNAIQGDCQSTVSHLKRVTTDAAVSYMTGPDNNQFSFVLPSNNFSINVIAEIIAVEPATGTIASFTHRTTKKRIGGVNTDSASSIVVNYADAGAATWSVGSNLSTNNLRIAVLGEAAKTIYWSARVTVVEVSF